MMQKMVEFAKSGSLTLALEPLPLAAFVDELCESLKPTLERAGVTLAAEAQLAPGFSLTADRLQLRRLLENLINNARDILLQSQCASPGIWLYAEPSADGVVLSVADNGRGLPAELAPMLFQPFANGRRRGGFGLGLSIVANLAKAHGGSVRAEAHG